LLHGRFPLFNSAHLRHSWPQVQVSGQLIQHFAMSHRVDMNRAVGFVPNPSGQAQVAGFADNKIAEANAVYTAGDNPGPGLLRCVFQ